jgi:methylated-DNA-[protein]-cysteine S-methyltransferase
LDSASEESKPLVNLLVRIKMQPKNPFNEKIYLLLKKVPKGRVTTYKILAEKLGTKAYRAVGQAMRRNPYSPQVPCHRVVCSSGFIGGFSGSIEPNSREVRKKITLLKSEGVEVRNNKINLNKFLFELD